MDALKHTFIHFWHRLTLSPSSGWLLVNLFRLLFFLDGIQIQNMVVLVSELWRHFDNAVCHYWKGACQTVYSVLNAERFKPLAQGLWATRVRVGCSSIALRRSRILLVTSVIVESSRIQVLGKSSTKHEVRLRWLLFLLFLFLLLCRRWNCSRTWMGSWSVLIAPCFFREVLFLGIHISRVLATKTLRCRVRVQNFWTLGW